MLTEAARPVTFEDVAERGRGQAGPAVIVEFLRDPASTSARGPIPRGVLLVGPPGTANADPARGRGRSQRAFFTISGSDFVESSSASAPRVRDMFEHAKKNRACFIISSTNRRRSAPSRRRLAAATTSASRP